MLFLPPFLTFIFERFVLIFQVYMNLQYFLNLSISCVNDPSAFALILNSFTVEFFPFYLLSKFSILNLNSVISFIISHFPHWTFCSQLPSVSRFCSFLISSLPRSFSHHDHFSSLSSSLVLFLHRVFHYLLAFSNTIFTNLLFFLGCTSLLFTADFENLKTKTLLLKTTFKWMKNGSKTA